MKTIILLLAALALSGCAKTIWIERREPTTEAERKAVAEQAALLLASTPRHISGDDQDWDDAIAEAYRQARQTSVRITFWEYQRYAFPDAGGHYTGRWRYAEEAK